MSCECHLFGALATGQIEQFLGHSAALQLLGMERHPEASPEGPRAAGIGQRRGCRDRIQYTRGRPHPASGSHLPAEGTAPPCAVAFRVVAPCSVPQKPLTPPRPTAGFRIINPCRESLTRHSFIPTSHFSVPRQTSPHQYDIFNPVASQSYLRTPERTISWSR